MSFTLTKWLLVTLQLLSLCSRKILIVSGNLQRHGKYIFTLLSVFLYWLSSCVPAFQVGHKIGESPQGLYLKHSYSSSHDCLLAIQVLAPISSPYRGPCWCLSLSLHSYFYHNTYCHWLDLYLLFYYLFPLRILCKNSDLFNGISPSSREGLVNLLFSKGLDNNRFRLHGSVSVASTQLCLCTSTSRGEFSHDKINVFTPKSRMKIFL